MIKFCFAALLAFSVFLPAGAGVVITGEGEGAFQKMYISGESLRFDSWENESVIFKKRAGDNTLFIIDKSQGVYYEITRGNLKELVKMIEQALQHMPEAQREKMRQMMHQQFGAAAVERKVELEQRGERVNDWTADRYAAYADGKKTSLAWFASPGQFGISAADLRVFEDFEKFWDPLVSLNIQKGAMILSGTDTPGVPVKFSEISQEGKESRVFLVTGVQKQNIPASVFEIPSGLRKKDFSFEGR